MHPGTDLLERRICQFEDIDDGYQATVIIDNGQIKVVTRYKQH